ncbi:hypothetical protein IP86_03470 [Rhodopseudomonas sp. AAP120]|nr:hypothetical protein IP86_03470 [Rhodopseudomonas sp. AAP120]
MLDYMRGNTSVETLIGHFDYRSNPIPYDVYFGDVSGRYSSCRAGALVLFQKISAASMVDIAHGGSGF